LHHHHLSSCLKLFSGGDKITKEVVKAIEDYFKKNPHIEWSFGGKVINSEETIRLLKSDKKFRKTVVDAVIKYSIEQLVRGDEV